MSSNRFSRIISKAKLRLQVAVRVLRGYEDSLPRSRFKLSFSQCGEDLIVWFLLGQLGIDRPTYLDVGAHHPETLSNTALFYLLGGQGINIEPDPVLFARFAKERKRDVNLNVGIGATSGLITFFRMADPSLSTFSEEEAERIAREEGIAISDRFTVPVDTIHNVLQTHQCRPDFISIDVEGK